RQRRSLAARGLKIQGARAPCQDPRRRRRSVAGADLDLDPQGERVRGRHRARRRRAAREARRRAPQPAAARHHDAEGRRGPAAREDEGRRSVPGRSRPDDLVDASGRGDRQVAGPGGGGLHLQAVPGAGAPGARQGPHPLGAGAGAGARRGAEPRRHRRHPPRSHGLPQTRRDLSHPGAARGARAADLAVLNCVCTRTGDDAQCAETVIRTAVAAIEKAYDFETAVSDKKRLEKLAATDALTGCLNRRALSEELEAELDRARRYNLALTILLADIDRFKLVNDPRGHLAGDSVLRQVGHILRRATRSVDLVARYGGEEFVVVMPETALHGSVIFAERL